MTDPNPLRGDEVEAVAEAIARFSHKWHALDQDGKDSYRIRARAAILRLDQVRGK